MGVGGQHHAPAALPLGKDPVPIVQEAGWAPGPVWTGAENRVPTGIRSPDFPARSESVYRLSYRGRHLDCSIPLIETNGKFILLNDTAFRLCSWRRMPLEFMLFCYLPTYCILTLFQYPSQNLKNNISTLFRKGSRNCPALLNPVFSHCIHSIATDWAASISHHPTFFPPRFLSFFPKHCGNQLFTSSLSRSSRWTTRLRLELFLLHLEFEIFIKIWRSFPSLVKT